MGNGFQLRLAIQRATVEVAEHGYEDADLRLVILAGFGYVADQIEASERGVVRIKLTGKKFMAIGMGVGGIIAGVGQALFQG